MSGGPVCGHHGIEFLRAAVETVTAFLLAKMGAEAELESEAA